HENCFSPRARLASPAYRPSEGGGGVSGALERGPGPKDRGAETRMKKHKSWRTSLRHLGCCFAAAIAFVAWPTAHAADADTVVQPEALVKAGRYAEAYDLLEPLEDRLAGDLKYDYLLARSALETGHPSKASFIYERILAVEPNYVGVRLEMGRAY